MKCGDEDDHLANTPSSSEWWLVSVDQYSAVTHCVQSRLQPGQESLRRRSVPGPDQSSTESSQKRGGWVGCLLGWLAQIIKCFLQMSLRKENAEMLSELCQHVFFFHSFKIQELFALA